MTYKENITAILECYFTGFKEEIIDSACNRILEQEPYEVSEYDKDHIWYKGHQYISLRRFLEVKAEAEQEPKWIPVTERLPKIADVYRVTRYYPNNVMNPNYLVDACFFDGSNTWYNDNRINHERDYVNNVIAWQKNPEPYEPKERSDKE